MDESGFWPNLATRPIIVIGAEHGKARRIAGVTSGAIASDENRVSMLRWNASGRLEYLVFQIGVTNVRLAKRGIVPGGVTGRPPIVNAPYWKSVAVDIYGPSLAVSGRGRTVVFNWRTGAIEQSMDTTPTDDVAVALAPWMVVVNARTGGSKYVPPTYSYAGYRRVDGQRVWAGSDFGPDLNIAQSPATVNFPRESAPSVDRLNPEDGIRIPVGSLAKYPPQPLLSVRHGIEDIHPSRVTWPEYDCYWTTIIAKRLDRTTNRPPINCSLRVLPGSPVLRGRTLTIRVRTRTGARFIGIYAKAGEYTTGRTNAPIAPGTQTIRLRLGPRVSDHLRKSADRLLTLDFELNPDGAVSTFTGRVKIRN